MLDEGFVKLLSYTIKIFEAVRGANKGFLPLSPNVRIIDISVELLHVKSRVSRIYTNGLRLAKEKTTY